jgi:hypothetical protein
MRHVVAQHGVRMRLTRSPEVRAVSGQVPKRITASALNYRKQTPHTQDACALLTRTLASAAWSFWIRTAASLRQQRFLTVSSATTASEFEKCVELGARRNGILLKRSVVGKWLAFVQEPHLC